MTETILDENRLIAERRQKLAQIREATNGVAFPNDVNPTHRAKPLHEAFNEFDKDTLAKRNEVVCVAGRMMLKRVMGKASFVTLQDATGRIQIYLEQSALANYDDFKTWDLGDIISVSGTMMKTNKGELSIHATEIRMVSKSLRPLPDKFLGMSDTELRYRQRYVDLIVNDEARETFLRRSQAMSAIRRIMIEEGFLEVETPMLHPIPGGAAAKPFKTHHNALDMGMYLRISPELYLKRLIVGGFERVFEINRNFRNEGISVRHNPEFTMMEFYAMYKDYHWLMDYTEDIIRQVAIETNGTACLEYQGRELDLSKPFDRLTIVEAVLKYAPEYTAEQLDDIEFLRTKLTEFGVDLNDPAFMHAGKAALQLAFFEETVEGDLWHPTFIMNHPVDISPLARASDTQKDITERFELFITGREIANGYSELNDPEDQAARFRQQVEELDAGNEEAMFYDADYVRALEHAMPPTGGCGIGIDRLIMLITNSASIRDVILFPHLKPENS